MTASRFRSSATLPALLTFLLAAALPASAEPALWKVQGPHATVYLFGGIHLLKNTGWRTPKVDAAFNASATLWEELSNADDKTAAQPLLVKYGVDAAHPLSTKLDANGKAKLIATTSALGVPENQIEPLQPWLAALQIGIAPLVKAGYDATNGVDVALKNLAVAQGKPVRGFETQEQQMEFFAALPQAMQTQFLLLTLDQTQTGPADMARLVDAWSAGDTAKVNTYVNVRMQRYAPHLYDVLLVQRNKTFAEDIEQLLNGDGIVFVAVGAGHLVGADSVIEDLARDGFTAVRQ